MNLLDLNINPGVEIVIVVISLVVCIGLAVWLFFGIRRDRANAIAEKLKIGELDQASFHNLLRKKYATANKNTHFAVIMFQMNDAKKLKDLGEKQYETVINTAIERLYKVFPVGVKICKYNDERIACYLEEDLDIKALQELCAFGIMEIHKPIGLVTKAKIVLDLYVGAGLYNAFNDTFDHLLQNLELSLGSAMNLGLNNFVVYSQDLAGMETDDFKRYQEIRRALAGNEFMLYYQPIYDLNSYTIVAFETLIRWNHPTEGVLTPDKFLPIMEQSGDVNTLVGWAFEEMLKAKQQYNSAHPNNNVLFTINLSPKQLMYKKLTEDFRRVLKKYKVDSQEICIEIYEFTMFEKFQMVAENIERLQQIGFKLAIDDFGVEMSTLKILENLNVDWVKLDRKLIEKAKTDFLMNGLIATLVNFAESKQMLIVAEGIEDDQTVEYIKSQKITVGQGYHFGRPLPMQAYENR